MRSRYETSGARDAIARWAAAGPDLALRVYTSRLLGAEPSLVQHGGGNTSVKTRLEEAWGEPVDVLAVKGSGWDLASIEPQGFPACRLAPLARVLALPALEDTRMVRALRATLLDPASPTPSVEALLHAFFRAKFVDHTHSSAVLTVLDQPDGAARARDLWGEDFASVPYVMPGFLLARRVAELGEVAERGTGMILEKHGIFTWGDTAEESYERMIAAVTRAEEAVARVSAAVPAAVVPAAAAGRPAREAVARRVLPALRGALARQGARLVLSLRDEPALLSLLDRADARELTAIGPMTPDHVLRTRPWPAWLGRVDPAASDEALRAQVDSALAEFRARYQAYFDRNAPRHPALVALDPLPRVLLAPGLGAIVAGSAPGDARAAGDLYTLQAEVLRDAAAMGGYAPVGEADLFDVEYWSLEQAKLRVGRASGGPLAGRVAAVTGAARGIGLAVASALLDAGALVVASDVDEAALGASVTALAARAGTRLVGFPADVTRPEEARGLAAAAVLAFGGLDLLVSNAGNAPQGLLHTEEGDAALRRSLELNLLGHQNVARAAAEVMLAQGTGGALLFNASKSAWNPGKEFGPYAVAKAAVIALMRQYAVDLGGAGIRASAVNADRIRTPLFDGIVEARARARGVSPDAYFRDNLLGRETLASDVAAAFVHLAAAEGTTGAVLTVDGGNAAAFPR